MKYFVDIVDKRNQILKDLLIQNGQMVEVFDFNKVTEIKKGDTVVFSPAKKFTIEEVEKLPKGINLVCGNVGEENLKKLKNKKIKIKNLMEDEIFTVKNANLTAEGVLAIILEKTDVSIFESNVLILGGGRIAKAMATILKCLGVNYAIVSFNPIKFPSYYLLSNKCYYRKGFLRDLKKYNVVVNTIPARIIDDEIINSIDPKTLFIETASVKCLDDTQKLDFEYLFAPALPQRYSAVSAGKLVYESIMGENDYGKD